MSTLAELDEGYSSIDICEGVGISYRMLDYWIRAGVLTSATAARGCGTQRRFSEDDRRAVSMIATLRDLGMSLDRCGSAAKQLRSLPSTGLYFVDRYGSVTALSSLADLESGHGYIVTLR